MFSTNVTDGANSVADAVDFSADSSAPKKSTCMTNGMLLEHQRRQHLLRIVVDQRRRPAPA